ncbi:MAG: hypothetical protein JEY96_01600 [Bacteroidales bacterium]|nr:hypothetical protein [Bacteroidales bacterium]
MNPIEHQRMADRLNIDEIRKALLNLRSAGDFSIREAQALFARAQSIAWTNDNKIATQQLDQTQNKQLDILLNCLDKPRKRENAFHDFIRHFSQDLNSFDSD